MPDEEVKGEGNIKLDFVGAAPGAQGQGGDGQADEHNEKGLNGNADLEQIPGRSGGGGGEQERAAENGIEFAQGIGQVWGEATPERAASADGEKSQEDGGDKGSWQAHPAERETSEQDERKASNGKGEADRWAGGCPTQEGGEQLRKGGVGLFVQEGGGGEADAGLPARFQAAVETVEFVI